MAGELVRLAFPERQNFEAEIDRLKAHLAVVKEKREQTPQFRQCEELLNKIQALLASRFYPALEVWLLFHLAYQQLLMIQDPPELLQNWATLRDRLLRIPEAERGAWSQDRVDATEKALKAFVDGDVKAEPEARGSLQALRKFIDDRTDTALWSALSLQRRVLASATLLVAVGISLAGRLYVQQDGLASAHAIDAGLLTTMLASLLGGTISMVQNMQGSEVKGPPVSMPHWPRPALAVAAGLFLWLVGRAGAFSFGLPIFYATAMAFGFSERLMVGALEKIGGSAETRIGQFTGMGKAGP